MGLDMYLSKRTKLSEEQLNRIEEIKARMEEIVPIINAELAQLHEQAMAKFKEPESFFSEEYDQYRKSIAEYMKDRITEPTGDLMEEHEELDEELNAIRASEEIHYWRKHSNLNGFLTDLYYEKGGEGDFNCVDLVLTREDVERIIAFESEGDEQEQHSGFFWGESTQEDREQSIKVFSNILKDFDFEKDELIYHCWY